MLLQYGVLTYSATKHSWKELKNLHCAWLLYKCWDLSYLELLDITGVLSLERRRDAARLCLLYKIVNHLCFFDLNVFSSCTFRSYHSHPLALTQPLSHTNSFYNSYVPATIRLWNNLDSITCSAPSYFSFKQQLISIFGSHVSD